MHPISLRNSSAYSCTRLIPISFLNLDLTKESSMIKYIVAWLLGVPAILLVIIYFFMN
jgi:hypothetical protein